MSEEAELIAKQMAYVDTIRAIGVRERNLGFLLCLGGSLALIWISVQTEAGAISAIGFTALAVIFVGWGLFFYSIVKRTRYVRAHPFDPNA